MKQQDIGFRELLERLLPIDELPPADRRAVQSALLSGVGAQIEQAALMALRRLEEAGALTRMDPLANGGGPVLRFQARDALRVFTLHLPGPVEQGGVRFVPRSSLPARSPAGVPQLRRLLRLDEPAASHDPVAAPSRDRLAEQLAATARELLGPVEVRFVPRRGVEPPADEPAIDSELAARVLADPDLLVACPDMAAAPALASQGQRLSAGSLVMIAVTAGAAGAAGHLEVTSRHPRAFDDDALSLVSLLADSFAAALERARWLERLVFVDPLTTVYNRTYFDLQMQNEMARAQRENASLGLCLVDIDNFKSFNTRFGYEAGNQVLVTVAHALRSGVRPFDTVSRWGGEEFAVLLTPPVSAADARTVSERLRGLVERHEVETEGLDRRLHHLGVTVSIGVALFPGHAASSQDLWRAANRALLEAKRPPKNRVVFFDPGM
jgi:diguanylate cyclase (GGDEF)-like protein